jgi:putative ABC transport system permease protein
MRLLRRREAEERMEEEIRFHLEMATETNLRAGMSPEEARRRARLTFGGVEGHKERLREGRTFAWASGLSLDVRLGWRMLRKYPGLTGVGVLGMAIAIAIGAVTFQAIYTLIDADLPLDEGDRVVALQYWNAATNRAERGSVQDFVAWHAELESVQELSAFRNTERNLIVPGGVFEPVAVAEMTASGFQVARVPPLLGRPLLEEDEQRGAPAVVVIGYDVWQTRFQGDPDVVERDVRLGNTVHTVVGVMPQGFAFPVNHSYWVPLRADPLDYERREGPALFAFGRLAPGVTMDEAQAELATIGQRMATSDPATYGQLRPQVLPYTHPFSDMEEPGMAWIFFLVQVFVSLLMVVVAVNVAILVYARTATRIGEIVVRSALGASRGRIVAQLSVEALVLSAGAAAVGLLIVWLGLRYWGSLVVDRRPFWLDFELSSGTMLYATGLAVLGAVIVGVVPALKATGQGMQSRLRQLGGATGMQMGTTWTILIVVQVAIVVAVLPVGAATVWSELRPGLTMPNSAAGDLLTARLAMNEENSPAAQDTAGQHQIGSRFADRHSELLRRLKAEPNVSAVTFAAPLPTVEFRGLLEIEAGRPVAEPARHVVRFLQVDPGFLDVFDATVLAGRSFESADIAGPATAVLANRSFVQQVLGGGEALGRRFRYTRTEKTCDPGTWSRATGTRSWEW